MSSIRECIPWTLNYGIFISSISNYHLCAEFETKPQNLKQWLHLSTYQPSFLENSSCVRIASINIFIERQSLDILTVILYI